MTDPTRPVPGYPAYPHPPPPPNSNHYYPQQQPPQPPRTTLFRRFISAVVIVFVILATVFFIVWLILRPRVPLFTLTTLTLTSLNLTSSQISATWTSQLTITNPNKHLHVFYDELEARLLYRSSVLSVTRLPPFDQLSRTSDNVTAVLTAAKAYIEPGLARRIVSDKESGGGVEFDLQVLALVRFKSGGWRVRRRGLRAFCDGLLVGVTRNGSSGSFSGGSRRCSVGI